MFPAVRILLAALPAFAAASPAQAEIFDVSFSGKGVITFSDNPGAPPIGTPVTVSGSLNFGEFALPDRFTGSVGLSHLNEGQGFSFGVDGADIYGDSGAVYRGASVSLLRGRVVGVSMYADYDGFLSELGGNRFIAYTGFHSPSGQVLSWGGKWALVPEPLTWAMMLAGFGAIGGAMRHRRRATIMVA